MQPGRCQGIPCATVPATSSKIAPSAAQSSHLSGSLPFSTAAEPTASPPLIAEWLQPLSAAACSLTRLPLHMKPALAAVRRVARSAFHVERCHCTEPCRSPRLGPLMYAGPTAIITLSASGVKEPVSPLIHGCQAQRGSPPSMRQRARISPL